MRKSEIIYLPKSSKSLKYKEFLFRTASVLKEGGVMVAPTDTIYGLLASAQKKKAVAKTQKIKGRDTKKPMPVLIQNFDQACKLGKFSPETEKFVKKLWPGPYTVVVKARKKMPLGVVSPNGSIALRVPKNKWLRDVIKIAGAPLVATSANPSAEKGAKSIKQAIKYFSNRQHKPDLYIDGGLIYKKHSTIIDCRNWPPLILRGKPGKKLSRGAR